MNISDNIILKVENISKQYRLGVVGTGTLSNDLTRWWHLVRGKEDPFLKIGETNDRSEKGDSDYVWSLKNIDFEVKKGEVLGIIGKNGAGKSTLLKILSRVTSPTTGQIKSDGRIASLLEVGTGFHVELTGRENVFLNGAILGMTKAEIASKIDEIIEFSGCERYIDTPVKRYSSGMTVRLAFAVAAFLEPDILIVDEVLAVGDAEFQKKAIGKMKEISDGDNGRTVLFVSHNMASMKKLCNRILVLDQGRNIYDGKVSDGIDYYLSLNKDFQESVTSTYNNQFPEENDFLEVQVKDVNENIRNNFFSNENIYINFKIKIDKSYTGARLVVRFLTPSEEVAFASVHYLEDTLSKQPYQVTAIIPKHIFNVNEYYLSCHVGQPGIAKIIPPKTLVKIKIESLFLNGNTYPEKWPGILAPEINWKH